MKRYKEKHSQELLLDMERAAFDSSSFERKNAVLEALERSTMAQCSIFFLLMGGLPIVIFIYLVAIRLFSWTIMVGPVGDLLLIALLLSVVGLFLSRRKVNSLINLIISYNKVLLEKEKEIFSLQQARQETKIAPDQAQ